MFHVKHWSDMGLFFASPGDATAPPFAPSGRRAARMRPRISPLRQRVGGDCCRTGSGNGRGLSDDAAGSPHCQPQLTQAGARCRTEPRRPQRNRPGAGTAGAPLVVMAGLVPLLSGLTSGRALCRQAGPSPPPAVTPDLIRGPEPQAPPSPGFPRIEVRGDNRGTRTAEAGGPQSVSPTRRNGRKPACTNASCRIQPILTGQQWLKAGVTAGRTTDRTLDRGERHHFTSLLSFRPSS